MQETCRENTRTMNQTSSMIHDTTPSGPGSTDVYMYISKLHQKCLAHPPGLNVPVPCSAMTRDTSPSEKVVTNPNSNDKTAKQATISHTSPL